MKPDRITLLSPVFAFAPYVIAWLAGPLLIRVPESGALLETIVGQQFWFYTVTASWFGLVTCIMQGIYDPQKRKGVLGLLAYLATLAALIAGFSLALQAIGTRIPRELFGILAVYLVALAILICATWRKTVGIVIVSAALATFLAAVLSLGIFALSDNWPSWPSIVASLSFAMPLTAKLSYRYGWVKTGNAAMVLLPIPLAWLLTVSLLATPYVAIGVLFLPISVLLSLAHSSGDKTPDETGSRQIDQGVGKITLTLAIILVAIRFLPAVY